MKESKEINHSWPNWWRIIALSSTILAVEFAYAVEAGYGTPTLLKTGLQERYATLLWSTGPVLGIIFQGYLGSASDKCTSSLGRRRPFILLVGIIVLVALALFPYGTTIANHISTSSIKPFVIVYTSVLFVSMDFSLDAIQSPTRSFLLDSVSDEQTHRGNLIYSTMIGIGATVGSIVSAIPWNKFGGEIGNNFETQTKVVFGVTVGLFVVCLVATLCSVNENHTKLLRQAEHSLNEGNEDGIDANSEVAVRPRPITLAIKTESQKAVCCVCSSTVNIFKDFCHSFQSTFLFAKNMSIHFFSLWILVILSFSAIHSLYLFFTEYVGSVIYGGIANSEDSHLRELYDEGVLAGCACLIVYNVSLSVASVVMDPIIEYLKLNLKTVLIFADVAMLIVTGSAMIVPSLVLAVFAALTCGMFYAVLTTIPFTLASHYEVSTVVIIVLMYIVFYIVHVIILLSLHCHYQRHCHCVILRSIYNYSCSRSLWAYKLIL